MTSPIPSPEPAVAPTPINLDQITLVVNQLAKADASKRGVSPDLFDIQLVSGLKHMMMVDMGKGPTIQVQMAWPECGPILKLQIKQLISLLLRHRRSQYSLVPLSFVQAELEKEGKRRMAWKKGRIWDDLSDRIPGLLDHERVRIEYESVTRYVDVMTGASVERRSKYRRMHTSLDDTSGWIELSKIVHEQHPESFEEDRDEGAADDTEHSINNGTVIVEQNDDIN